MATASSVTGRLVSLSCRQCGESFIVDDTPYMAYSSFCCAACRRASEVSHALTGSQIRGAQVEYVVFDEEAEWPASTK